MPCNTLYRAAPSSGPNGTSLLLSPLCTLQTHTDRLLQACSPALLPASIQSGALIRSEWDVLAAEPPLPRILHSNRRIFLPSHTLMPALHRTYSRMHCTASHMLTPALQRTPILTPALHCRHTYTSRLHCTGMFQVRMHTKAGACSSTDMCLIVHRLLMCSRISGSECVCARERYKIGSL